MNIIAEVTENIKILEKQGDQKSRPVIKEAKNWLYRNNSLHKMSNGCDLIKALNAMIIKGRNPNVSK